MYIRKKFSTEIIINHCNGLPRRWWRHRSFRCLRKCGSQCYGLVDIVVLDHRLASLDSEVFSNQTDSVILLSRLCSHPGEEALSTGFWSKLPVLCKIFP